MKKVGGNAMIFTIRWLFLAGITLSLAGTALGGVTTTCEPEPTDMSISYGDFITCDIDLEGDTDIYRLHFNVGDGVRIELTDTGVGSVILQLFDPTGQEIYNDFDGEVEVYDNIISTAGIYTLVVKSVSDTAIGAYSVYLTCIGGSCMPVTVPEVISGGGVSLSSAYVNLDITNGSAPPTSHCQDDSHYGRMILDDVNSILYVCEQTGWATH